jgi:hypothetical protein
MFRLIVGGSQTLVFLSALLDGPLIARMGDARVFVPGGIALIGLLTMFAGGRSFRG